MQQAASASADFFRGGLSRRLVLDLSVPDRFFRHLFPAIAPLFREFERNRISLAFQ